MDGSEQTGKHMNGKHRLETHDREIAALQLRRSGATYDVIAARLGYHSRSGAWKAVERVLKATRVEEASSLRLLEADRLDRMQLALWPRAVQGNANTVLACLRVMERRARLLGLDEPTRVSNEVVLRRIAARAADEMGLDIEEVVAEAQRILDDASDE